MASTIKGFIRDFEGNKLLPITRAELVLDQEGQIAITSHLFEAGLPGNAYGLISATDLAKLKGGSDGQSMDDIYKKLGYINSSLKVNNTPLTFYSPETNAAVATDINITTIADQLSIGVANNTISLGLAKLSEQDLEYGSNGTNNEIIKSIEVDKYGRVINVSGGKLTDSEIPPTLTGKALEGCTTTGGDKAESLVNKKYVDDAITQVTGIATGALHFVGALSSTQGAVDALANDAENSYYKVTADFPLSSEYLHLQHEIPAPYSEQIKIGDTLIKKDSKFIHIPSGDDVTSITIKKSNVDPVINDQVGSITFDFSDVFDVSASYKHATITLPPVSATDDGYLKAEDYVQFKNYAQKLLVTYEQSAEGAGIYDIGTIKVGETSYTIQGINNESILTLENGSTDANNPILQFKETGKQDKKITIQGTNGISAVKNGDTIELKSTARVAADSTDYLNISSDQVFTIKQGSRVGDTLTEGITKYSEFDAFYQSAVNLHRNASYCITLAGSLKEGATGSDEKTYKYGTQDLITAISVTI